MTSERDVELTRALYATWNDEGLDAVAARFWHDDIELRYPPQLLDSDIYVGRAAVAAALRRSTDAIGHFRIDVKDVWTVGDEVISHHELSGAGTAGGVPFSLPVWHLLRFRDDRIDRVEVHLDEAGAVAAAGPDPSSA